MPEPSLLVWALMALAAALVGISKTALPGANTVSIVLFAAILPAKASTGALLLLLIVGDIIALSLYRRHAQWPTLIRLVPAVLAGLALGVLFLALANDAWVRRVIGVVLLLVIGITLWRRWRGADAAEPSRNARWIAAGTYGTLGGFTTMVANAGGPVMTMYFLASHFSVKTFLGTAAWFFAIVNLIKVPFSVGLGLINTDTLLMDLALVPAVVVGGFVGRWLTGRMDQRVFERITIVLTIAGAIYLLI